MVGRTHCLECIQPSGDGSHITAIGIGRVGTVDSTGGQEGNACAGEVAHDVGP